MSMKTYRIIAGLIFAVVALGNIARIYMALPVTIGTHDMPIWVSYIHAVVAGAMCYFTFKLPDR